MHVFVLVGRSGTGKSTLQQRSRLVIPQQYTTREKREGENCYVHLTIEEYIDSAKSGHIIFPNFLYNNFYGVRAKDFEDVNTCVVLDAIGLRQCQEHFGFDNVTGIMIDVPITLLKLRMMKRGSTDKEIRKRLSLDSNKFKNIYHLCDYKITNDNDIEDSVFELHSIIREVLNQKGE